jgi:hypothetical protein
MAVSLGAVGSRVVIRLPVGSPGERIAATVSLDPILGSAFRNVTHTGVWPTSVEEQQYNSVTQRMDTNNICIVVAYTNLD